MTNEILVVDDNLDIRLLISSILKDKGFSVREAANFDQALNEINRKVPDAAVIDVKLDKGDNDGIELLTHIKKIDDDVPVIMISGHANVQMAVNSLKLGAFEFMQKPYTAIVIEALRKRFPKITGPKKNDICYATQNRQDALKKLAKQSDIILVVGSPNSSNSNRLRELAEKRGVPAFLIDGADDIQKQWLTGINKIGVTAGASAPDILVSQVTEKLESMGADVLPDDQGIVEDVSFVLPKELRKN